MTYEFQFITSKNIIFGIGKVQNVIQQINQFGKKVLLITRKNQTFSEKIQNDLKYENISLFRYEVKGEPEVETINMGVRVAREHHVDCIISYGGGSVIDTGKAIAALTLNDGGLLDYLEVVGLGKKLEKPSIPFIAIPTTAGTGSEVTKNAVISVPEHKVKVSLRSNSMLPTVSIIDPELTISMPKNVTASTGMDAFAQVLEPYVSKKANAFTDLFCIEGMKIAPHALVEAYNDGNDINARVKMSWVSLLGGLSLANAGLGAAHGIAGPFGGEFNAPHGAIVARLLPEVVAMNIFALNSRGDNQRIIKRYEEILKIFVGHPKATINNGIEWLRTLCIQLEIPGLSKYGIHQNDIPVLVKKSQASSSMKGNPIQLTDDEVSEIINKSM